MRIVVLGTITLLGAACVGSEPCPDGTLRGVDGCPSPPGYCGDGIVNGPSSTSEECDPGYDGDSNICDRNCTLVACGDGHTNLDAGEECDDGNRGSGDGCSASCVHEDVFCGNEVVEGVEVCDDGKASATCDDDCTAVACGDGLVNQAAGEACDDGALEDGDGCSAACALEAPPGGCASVASLGCNQALVMGQVTDPGSTTLFASYTCDAGQDLGGNEMIYEWIADRSGTIGLSLEVSGGARVIVLQDAGSCTPEPCLAAGAAFASFSAVAGTRYLVVIDSPPGSMAGFGIGLVCD